MEPCSWVLGAGCWVLAAGRWVLRRELQYLDGQGAALKTQKGQSGPARDTGKGDRRTSEPANLPLRVGKTAAVPGPRAGNLELPRPCNWAMPRCLR
ncbi:hypothetical protein VDGL01_09245 [Verticillium dahliae]